MANERERVYATTVNHIVDGPSLTSGSFSADTDVDTAMSSTNSAGYDLAEYVLTIAFTGGAPTALRLMNLYAQRLNVVSTNDAELPVAAYPYLLVASFPVNSVTSTQYIVAEGFLPYGDVNLILENDTDVTSAANFDLDVKPYSYVPGA